jgi:hypothetical protein
MVLAASSDLSEETLLLRDLGGMGEYLFGGMGSMEVSKRGLV